MIHALDVSVYSKGSPLDSQDIANFQTEGYTLLVVQIYGGKWNRFCLDDMLTARDNGMMIAGYILLVPGEFAPVIVDQAKNRLVGVWNELKFVAIDAEQDGLSLNAVHDAVVAVQDRGQRPILYTRLSWWYKQTKNSTLFADMGIPLWDAHYDNSTVFEHPVYGGWEKQTGKQYVGDTRLMGIGVDLNIFDEEWVKGMDAAKVIQNLKNRATYLRQLELELRDLNHENYADALESLANDCDQDVTDLGGS